MENGRENFDLMNLSNLMTAHDYNDSNIMVGMEKDCFGDIAVVVYDVSEMLENPIDIEHFYDIAEENALDIEDFKINLFTIINAPR